MITAFYTCNRQPAYIGQTLSSYFDLYDEKPYVFEQESPEPYLNRTRVHRVATKATSIVENWLEMVEWLVSNTQDELYMLCEDDILFRQRIDLPKLPTGFISPYCSTLNKNGDGWHEPRMVNGLTGALCLIFTRWNLEFIHSKADYIRIESKGYILDYAIGEAFKHRQNLVHYPTLILHIGDVSCRASNNSPENRTHESRMPAL